MSDRYQEFIAKQLENVDFVISLIDDLTREVTPLRLNTALAHFTSVCVALNSESHRKSRDLQFLQDELQIWMDAGIQAARAALVDELGKSAAYKVSARELEAGVRVSAPERYTELRTEVIELEAELGWCNRTLIQLNKHGDILEQIGNNMRGEIRLGTLEVRMNKPDLQVKSFRSQPAGVPVREIRV